MIDIVERGDRCRVEKGKYSPPLSLPPPPSLPPLLPPPPPPPPTILYI